MIFAHDCSGSPATRVAAAASYKGTHQLINYMHIHIYRGLQTLGPRREAVMIIEMTVAKVKTAVVLAVDEN